MLRRQWFISVTVGNGYRYAPTGWRETVVHLSADGGENAGRPYIGMVKGTFGSAALGLTDMSASL